MATLIGSFEMFFTIVHLYKDVGMALSKSIQTRSLHHRSMGEIRISVGIRGVRAGGLTLGRYTSEASEPSPGFTVQTMYKHNSTCSIVMPLQTSRINDQRARAHPSCYCMHVYFRAFSSNVRQCSVSNTHMSHASCRLRFDYKKINIS